MLPVAQPGATAMRVPGAESSLPEQREIGRLVEPALLAASSFGRS
jgi:hypothetical protein